MTLRASTSAVDDTRALAAVLADLARPGDVLLLTGELGAGKTAFAQGFAAGLGVGEQVTSPTFTLARRYEGRLVLNHLDVYRLDHVQEAVDLGLAELVDEGAVTLIEWGDVVVTELAPDYLLVRLLLGAGPDDRTLSFEVMGARWQLRTDALHALLERWLDPPPC